MVDFGASHNVLKKELASELRLRVELCCAFVKLVNSKAKATTRVAFAVHIQLDKWKGCANFAVLQMDEFEVILG